MDRLYFFTDGKGETLFTATLANGARILKLHDQAIGRIEHETEDGGTCDLHANGRANMLGHDLIVVRRADPAQSKPVVDVNGLTEDDVAQACALLDEKGYKFDDDYTSLHGAKYALVGLRFHSMDAAVLVLTKFIPV